MSSLTSSPILRTIVNSMRRLYPEHLADKSFDNTGLLLESHPLPRPLLNPTTPRILLTIDLTTKVCTEAISLGASCIITYHPIIFFGLKSITLANSQQKSLLRLAQEGISVYSPHTAIDAAVGGVNDWIADGISGGKELEAERKVIEKVRGVEGTPFDGAGMGRIVTLKDGISLTEAVGRIKKWFQLSHLQVAVADKHRIEEQLIKTVGICAGSGGSLLRGVKADLLVSGELSHHEVLPAVENGTSVISCFHSNSERGFLKAVLKGQLEGVLSEEWVKVKKEGVVREFNEDSSVEEAMEKVTGWEVVVSGTDQDPYEVL